VIALLIGGAAVIAALVMALGAYIGFWALSSLDGEDGEDE